jgi:tetratricopeptide (TPR) repeat protein
VRPYDLAIRHAEALLRAGNSAGAIEPLRDALTAAPEEAYPHLLLAQALRRQGRLTGARYEAERAVALAPLWSSAHLELAQVLLVQQHESAALASADQAIELDPDDGYAHLVRAKLLRIRGKRAEAQASLAMARALEPAAPAIIAEEGYAALEQGRMDRVETSGREILSINPEDSDGLILIGHAALARRDTDEALRLALAALANAPTDIDALQLLASVKMKKNPIGGLWWRWNRLLIKLGEARAIFFVVAIWVVYRWAVLASRDLGFDPMVENLLSLIYLGFVIYTISAGAVVRHMVAREVAKVRLSPSF